MRFNVTFEIVTPESAEHGDAAEHGFISEGVRLRDAIRDLFETRTSRVDGIAFAEAFECGSGFAVRVGNGREFETGAHESRTLHIPGSVTDASRARILSALDRAAGFTIPSAFPEETRMKTIEYTLLVTVDASITVLRDEDDDAPTPEELIALAVRQMDRSGGMECYGATFYACNFQPAGPVGSTELR